MSQNFDFSSIVRRTEDNSYVIQKDGAPYHVPNEGTYSELWSQVDAYAKGHPATVTEEHPYTPTAQELAERELAKAKSERAAAVAAITVVVDGMTFDGDEAAQERMSRAVVLADSMDETTEWVLHDNTVAIVTADQLRRACKLAGKAQTRLWTVPYNQVEEVKDAQQAEVPTGSTGYFAS